MRSVSIMNKKRSSVSIGMCARILLVALALITGTFSVPGVNSYEAFAATQKATLTLSVPSTLPSAEQSFDVSVKLSSNADVGAMQFTLSYNKDLLTRTDSTVGGLLKSENVLHSVNNDDEQGKVRVAAAGIEALSSSGTLYSFKFTPSSKLTSWSSCSFSISDIMIKDTDGLSVASSVVLPKEPQNNKPNPTPAPSSGGGGAGGGGGGGGGGGPTPATETKPQPEPTPEVTTPVEEEQPVTTQPEISTQSAIVFTDTANHWGQEYIQEAVSRKLFNGYSDGRFGPDDKVSRVQFITVLWRMAGSPVVNTSVPFRDISSQSDEFKKAIVWGYTNNIINGTGSETFDPTGNLTREQSMKMFYACAGAGTENISTEAFESQYKDSKDVSSWAKTAVFWATNKGIISGTSSDTLSPKNDVTRAQLAKIMVLFQDNYGGVFA